MTKTEAAREVMLLSSGTIACIIKDCRYSAVTDTINKWAHRIADAAPNAFKDCENWMQVLDIINN